MSLLSTMRDIIVIENSSSCTKSYTQLFEFDLKILNNKKLMSNSHGGRLKD